MSDDEGDNFTFEGQPVAIDVSIRTDGGSEGLNHLLGILASDRRRYALYYLRENDITDVDTLARRVAEEVDDGPSATITDERVERTKTRVVHTDLPKLRDAGIIEYDPRSGTVRYQRPTRPLTILLRVCSELENPTIGSE